MAKKQDNGENANTPISYEFDKDVTVEPNHSSTVSIQWRQPKNSDGHSIFDVEKFKKDHESKINELIDELNT